MLIYQINTFKCMSANCWTWFNNCLIGNFTIYKQTRIMKKKN